MEHFKPMLCSWWIFTLINFVNQIGKHLFISEEKQDYLKICFVNLIWYTLLPYFTYLTY